MPRKLSAIEIAEGALLADIAVIFQLFSLYLPIGKGFLRILIPIVFTIIVLRRRLYVGVMGLCVALFIVGIMTGPNYLVTMLLEGIGGLFLGLTMKYRLGHFIILFVSVTCGALALFGTLILFTLTAGLPLISLIKPIHVAYASFIAIVNFIASHIGLGSFWQHNVYPIVNFIANLAFTYWLAFWYVSLWLFMWPVVIIIYYVTNYFVRLLGHDVRPFPSGVIYSILQSILHTLMKIAYKFGIGKRGTARAIIKEARRQSIGRYRAKV
jgi:hypothetical protein